MKPLHISIIWLTFAPFLNAAIAQLVEHDLAKVGVASSSLVCRSKSRTLFLLFYSKSPGGGIGRRVRFRCVCCEACRFESCSGHYRLESKRVLKHSGKALHTNWENMSSCGLTKERLRGCWTCKVESYVTHSDEAQVVKLVYTLLWGGSGRKIVWVRVSSCAQGLKINKLRVRRVEIDPKSAQMTFTDVEVICRL